MQETTIDDVVQHGANLNRWPELTDREAQVAALLARGRSSREVAEALAISQKTIDTHRAHVLKKLGLRNNAELAVAGVVRGEVQTDTCVERHLMNLLARIHRDGGHYVAEHGLEKAVADADAIVARLNAEAVGV